MIKPVTGEQIRNERAIFNKAWEVLKSFYSIEQNSSNKNWESLKILEHIETVSIDRESVQHNTELFIRTWYTQA